MVQAWKYFRTERKYRLLRRFINTVNANAAFELLRAVVV